MLWLKFGLGRHEVVVQEEDPLNIMRFYQTIFANEIMYPMGLASARLSLVVLYHRIFGLFSARFYLYGLVAFIGAWAIYAVSLPISRFSILLYFLSVPIKAGNEYCSLYVRGRKSCCQSSQLLTPVLDYTHNRGLHSCSEFLDYAQELHQPFSPLH